VLPLPSYVVLSRSVTGYLVATIDNCTDAEATLAHLYSAFTPFTQYVDWLVRGTLDTYVDSVQPELHTSVPGMVLCPDSQLLLHRLGKNVDERRMDLIFSEGVVFVVFQITAETDV
jgi:hypothetical protein